jgi:zinc transporter ZupT
MAIASAAAGVWLTSMPDISRRIVPFSGAVLIGISLFLVLPELSEVFGWAEGLTLMSAGFLVLFVIDRYIYPVCPACAHSHDHVCCNTRLHGFAPPLIAAALLHSLFDGWALAAGQDPAGHNFGHAISLGVALHKLPEGVAFGVILRAALQSPIRAFLWAAITQGIMLLGGLLELATSSYIGPHWITVLLAIGGGTFLYLGVHAVHGEWKRRTAEIHHSHT